MTWQIYQFCYKKCEESEKYHSTTFLLEPSRLAKETIVFCWRSAYSEITWVSLSNIFFSINNTTFFALFNLGSYHEAKQVGSYH